MSELTSPRSGIDRPPAAEDAYASAERRQAARALLCSPLIVDDGGRGAEDLARVRRHRDALAALFASGLGYRLEVEPGAARLFKPGLGRDASRPLLRRNGRPFTPRAYALLCLVLAALSRCREQLLVDELVAEVRSAAADAGLDVDLDTASDRRALHAALTTLVGLGVLRERDGDLDAWAENPRESSLLDVRRSRLRLFLGGSLAGAESPEDLLETSALPSAAGGARIAVRRRLVESPLLTTADLPDDQAEWWRRNRGREREWLRENFGLELELRAEGAAAFDPDEELTDLDFPGQGSRKHYALLLLAKLVDALRADALVTASEGRAWRPVPAAVASAAHAEVVAEFGSSFSKDHREKPDLLHREGTDLLVQMGLLRKEDDGGNEGWLLHAAAARYAPVPRRPAAPTLFDDEPDVDGPDVLQGKM